MYRAAVERQRAFRTYQENNRLCDTPYHDQSFQPNRFRKGQKVYGRCGNPHCKMCYTWDEKRLGIKTHRQNKIDLISKESLQDYNDM